MDEKRFNIVIVDAPNLLIEDFKPYWSAGQVGVWHAMVVHLPDAILVQSYSERRCHGPSVIVLC